MKNRILIILSLVITVIGILVNISTIVDREPHIGNFILSLCVLTFWLVYILLSLKSKGGLIYIFMYWLTTFVVSILGMLYSAGIMDYNAIHILLLIFLSPIYGFRYYISLPIVNLIVLAIIAFIYMYMSGYFLKKSFKKKVVETPSLPEEENLE